MKSILSIIFCVSHSDVSNSATPWTVAHQAPLSMKFSRQEYWSGLPIPAVSSYMITNWTNHHLTALVAQTVKHLSTMRENQVRSLGWEDPLEEEMAIYSSILTWKSHGQKTSHSPRGSKEWGNTEQQSACAHTHTFSWTDSRLLLMMGIKLLI